MVIYKTMEVQKKLKELLDKVDAGEQVRIQRKGAQYVVINEEKLQELVNSLFNQRVEEAKGTTAVWSQNPVEPLEGYVPTSPTTIRSQITELEAELASGINQDPDFIIETRQKIQALWDEYHAMKEAM